MKKVKLSIVAVALVMGSLTAFATKSQTKGLPCDQEYVDENCSTSRETCCIASEEGMTDPDGNPVAINDPVFGLIEE